MSFQHTGVVRAYCPLHSTLPGVILVVPATHHTVPDALGNFQIGRLPAGRYLMSLWTEGHGVAAREVSLTVGEVKHADLTARAQR